MEYGKPHLTYDKQVQLLASRGMDVGNEADAVQALRRIGYYRLSAYTYPMRAEAAAEAAAAGTQRSTRFVEGARLVDAVALHDFDDRLRRTLLPGIQALEVGLRSKVAYHLGKHGAKAHLTEQALDPRQCQLKSTRPNDKGLTGYECWRREYDSLKSKCEREEYVRHFDSKYNGEVPIWAAVEFLTLGSLVSLYRLLQSRDAGRIAEEFGVKNRDVLHGWLKALNVERNHCAHNSRIWNRSTTYPPDKINVRMLKHDELHHLAAADAHKVYFLAAVLSSLLRHLDQNTKFPADFRTTMSKFHPVLGMTPENTMGFVQGWKDEPLWSSRP